MRKRCWLLVALFVVVVAGCKRGETAVQQQKTAPAQTATGTEPGAMMPEYSAMNLDGSKFELATRRDKVVLLNLWATWCGPCRYEIPELQRMHDEYSRRGFEVVGVSVDESGIESIREFVGENKMTYPVVLDPQGKLANVLEASVLPTSVLIGRDGKIVWKKVGAILEGDEELKSAIEKAL
ncbi:MAG TPA: TlpA disulfide reductase family protein [Thermoanaerobaculia bacterium]|nr:TlpA disulfide reductase family protein [Thermoanaerobaculia bacterium]